MTRRAILAWAVHLYTALGLVLAAVMAVLLVRGGEENLHAALRLMVVATAIDATDGWLARRVGVRAALPWFDGRRLDDIIDFHTYTSLPLLLIWRAEVLPPEWSAWLLLPLLASAYGFCQEDAKTPDGYFLGFPSYWNVLAIYLLLLRPPREAALAVILGLAVLTFVPSKYLYPSQPGFFNRLGAVLAGPWLVLMVVILLVPLEDARPWLAASLVFPAYYMAASWYVTLRDWRRRA